MGLETMGLVGYPGDGSVTGQVLADPGTSAVIKGGACDCHNEVTERGAASRWAAGAYALGLLFTVIAYATLSADSTSGVNTFRNLGHASDWLQFVGFLIALSAVCAAGWESLRSRRRDIIAELGMAAVATLLVAIGSLIQAASSSMLSTANVLSAIGIGLWAILTLSRAARYNLAEQQAPGSQARLAPLWLTASLALVLLAIGSGLTVELTDRGLGIASGILQALGFGILAWVLIASRASNMLQARAVRSVIKGLVLSALASVVAAVVAGIVFTPHATLKGLRIGISIAVTIMVVGIVFLGISGWVRFGELVTAQPVPDEKSGGLS